MRNKLIIGTELDTKSFDAQIELEKTKLKQLEEIAKTMKLHIDIGDNAEKLKEVEADIEKVKNNIIDLKNKSKGKGIDLGFKEGLKDLKKFALGLVGIRGIYSMVRKASSAWLSQDTELAKKFENIWLALGAALAPILEALANLMYKLLGYLNEFVKAFTNGKVDIIATANAKALQKQANAMKELKNQTYGFDELNIQQVNDTSSSGSVASGTIPKIELDPNVKKTISSIGDTIGTVYKGLKDIIKWVNDNLGVGGVITIAIVGLIGVKALTGGGLLGILAIIEAIAIGAAYVVGLLNEINSSVIEGNKNQKVASSNDYYNTYENLSDEDKIKGRAVLIKNIGDNTNNIIQKGNEYWKANSGILGKIFSNLGNTNKRIKSTIDLQKTSAKEAIQAIMQIARQGDMSSDEIETLTQGLKKYYEVLKEESTITGDNVTDDLKQIDQYIKELSRIKTYVSINAEDNATPTIEKVENGLTNLDGTEANTEVDTEDNASGVIDEIDGKLTGLDGKTAHTTVETTYTTKDKTTPIKQDVQVTFNGQKIGTVTGETATMVTNMLKLLGLSSFGGVKFGATGGVLNKCAVGSIINNPGRGVYLGNNTIGGEAGKEGLIPLTDPNAMTELGETIGKYITVNLTNVTKLDSKTINKETKKISNDMDFIRNGGVA